MIASILDGILNNVEQKSRYKRLFDFYEAHEYKYNKLGDQSGINSKTG